MSLIDDIKRTDGEEGSAPEAEEPEMFADSVFVVQKHHARQLHYDFRLEIDGVLKSWAVPKGPSMNPHDKRLAVTVSDRALDYAGFEGEIPAGQYGAGSVQVWDTGTWRPLEECRDVNESLDEGLLEFTLQGKKLKGEFRIVAMRHTNTKQAWLLIKGRDEYATDEVYDANER